MRYMPLIKIALLYYQDPYSKIVKLKNPVLTIRIFLTATKKFLKIT